MKRYAVNLRNFRFTAWREPNGSLRLSKPTEGEMQEGVSGPWTFGTPVVVEANNSFDAKRLFQEAMSINSVNPQKEEYYTAEIFDPADEAFDDKGQPLILFLPEPVRSKPKPKATTAGPGKVK